MAGYKLEKVATTDRGNLDLDDLRAKVERAHRRADADEPFDARPLRRGHRRGGRIFHDAGALLYYDGANLNAVVGRSRPGRHGLRHRPLQPPQDVLAAARRRWPGGGPVAVRADLEPFLPSPQVVRDGEAFRLDRDRPKSIGRVRGFAGPFGVFVRSYAFMRAYGPDLQAMSETAVLNANYVLARLRDDYEVPYDRLCMHEFVLSARALKKEHGITALDIAKRLMDYGVHPPTIYFPLVVPEALMIEPTETEPKERLDAFIEVMKKIAREAAENPGAAEVGAAEASGAAARRGEGGQGADRQARVRRAATAQRRGGGVGMPILRELIAAVERARRCGAKARPAAPGRACRARVHAQRRSGRARPRGIPRRGRPAPTRSTNGPTRRSIPRSTATPPCSSRATGRRHASTVATSPTPCT